MSEINSYSNKISCSKTRNTNKKVKASNQNVYNRKNLNLSSKTKQNCSGYIGKEILERKSIIPNKKQKENNKNNPNKKENNKRINFVDHTNKRTIEDNNNNISVFNYSDSNILNLLSQKTDVNNESNCYYQLNRKSFASKASKVHRCFSAYVKKKASDSMNKNDNKSFYKGNSKNFNRDKKLHKMNNQKCLSCLRINDQSMYENNKCFHEERIISDFYNNSAFYFEDSNNEIISNNITVFKNFDQNARNSSGPSFCSIPDSTNNTDLYSNKYGYKSYQSNKQKKTEYFLINLCRVILRIIASRIKRIKKNMFTSLYQFNRKTIMFEVSEEEYNLLEELKSLGVKNKKELNILISDIYKSIKSDKRNKK